MLKDDFVIVGIGQGGGKMVKPFYDQKYRSFFINTSYEDLKSLGVDDKYIYHIPAAKGCAKKRDVALNYAKNYYEQMVGKLIDTHPTAKIYIVHYTLGGGTGGGLSNFVLATMRAKLGAMGKRDIKIIAVAAKPRKYETYQIQSNAKASLTELYAMVDKGIVDQYLLINNDSRESLEEINEGHMMLFDRWIQGEAINNTNNADESERMDIFNYSGSVVLFDFACNNVEYFGEEMLEAYDTMFYCKPLKQPATVGMAINESVSESKALPLVEEVVGYFPNSHFTPTETSNLLMLAGMNENKAIMNELNKLINEKLEKINTEIEDTVEEVEVQEYKRDKKVNKPKEEDDDKVFTMDDVMKLFG